MARAPVQNKLHYLVWKGKREQIQELLNRNKNAVDLMSMRSGVLGFTPIHEAVSQGRADILQVLLSKGGNANALSNGNYTPIQIAASKGDIECIKVLLEFKANLSLPDGSRTTPLAIATANKKWKAARVLRTQELKELARNDRSELKTMLKGLQPGQDVEDSCFEDALEIAVHENKRRAVRYLVLCGARNVEKCMQAALLDSNLHGTAVILLLFHASKVNDEEMVKLICTSRNGENQLEGATMGNVRLTRNYLPKEWNHTLTSKELGELREAVHPNVKIALVAFACNWEHFEVAWTFLSEFHCKRKEEEADWHNLALKCIHAKWIERIINYKRILLSQNKLDIFPHEITKMKLLTQLDLSKNYIGKIPKKLFEMKHLRDLNLSSNRIQYLPTVERWTKSLKTLNLRKNSLVVIDGSISKSELEDLNLSDNELSDFPSCVCKIKTLQVLDLSRNQNIKVLPPDLAKLSKLKYLGIEKMDQITDPPSNLRRSTIVLLRYLKAKLRNSKPYYTMKLMTVGVAGSGKTTIMHRISGDFGFCKNTPTQGIFLSV